jgi:Flp pilus assembly protein TadG
MTLDRIANGLRTTAARFARARRGNVAMMFSLMLPVLLTSVGAAIDYSKAVNARSAMQAAADATALMISKEATALTAEQITSKAQAYFNALYNRPEVGGVTFSATYTANGGNGASVVLNAAGTMQTDFMMLAGFPTVSLNVSSTTKWGSMRYRVALALDNTGSMNSDDKMNQLKIATKQLINDFYGMAGSNDDVYISIVPFSKDVNVGSDKKDETWVRWTEWDSNNTQKVCTIPQYTTKTQCQNNGGSWINVAQPHSNWNGCVTDRDQDYDVSSATPSSSVTGTMAPAEQYSRCPVAMMGMTSVKQSKQSLINKVDDMTPNGLTNQAIGLAWAWLTHAPSGPFPAPPKDANYGYQDVIILMTDGLNTENRWYSDQASIDTRQSTLCTNAKAAGMKIFAIQVATGGDAVSTMLKNCTSEPNNPNYFSYITNASQMTVKFQNIFKELSKLRVTS